MNTTGINRPVLSLVFVVAVMQTVVAEETKVSQWKGEAELGYVATSGNTNTENLNAKAKFVKEVKRWKYTGIAEATRASDSDVATAKRYFVSNKLDYNYSVHSYIFGLVNYEDDQFSGYNYQASLIAGYGRKVIDTDTVKLAIEVGLGSKHSETIAGVKSDEGVTYGSMDYDWVISKSASFNEKLTVESGDDVTTTKSVSSLKAKINSKLASKFTYTVKHTSDVPVGVEKVDHETAVTLVYSF